MTSDIKINSEFEVILEKHITDHSTSYRIVRKVVQISGKSKAYAKFVYYNSVTQNDDYYEMLVFNENCLTENEAFLIFNFIIDLFKERKVRDLNGTIKFIKSTFGNYLGFQKNDIVGKFGELLVILHCLKNNIDLSKFFNNNDNDLFDFYLTNNSKYLEVKTGSGESDAVNLNIKQLSFHPDKTGMIIVKLKEDKNGLKIGELILKLLEFENTDIDFKNYLLGLQSKMEADYFAEELRFDIENVIYKLYLPEDLANKFVLLEIIKDANVWKNIEAISLKVNFSGLDSRDILEVENFLGD